MDFSKWPILGLFFFSIITSLSASDVVDIKTTPQFIQETKVIEEVEYGDLDVFEMNMSVYESGGMKLKLLCSFNTFYEYPESMIVLTADRIHRGTFFKLDDHDCLKLFNFFKKGFEYVSEEAPLEIRLNWQTYQVEKIKWSQELAPAQLSQME